MNKIKIGYEALACVAKFVTFVLYQMDTMSIKERIGALRSALPDGVTLVAVSKTHPVERVMEAYEAGQRVFGENRVQELLSKVDGVPDDVEWHLIGHLQRNKVRQVLPHVALIHSVDSVPLLNTIEREADKIGRQVRCLLQVHIAQEETKFGFGYDEALELFKSGALREYHYARVVGLMGMATNTPDEQEVGAEFERLRGLFELVRQEGCAPADDFGVLSMGMSGDYRIALAHGSTMVRVGSGIFGLRERAV